jgi:glucose-1-phosphate thymidylyltransferase
VKLNDKGEITEFIEKPKEFVSDLAIIGIYYFKDGEYLRSELQYLIDNDIRDKGEYQLTNALENMKTKGSKFVTGKVVEWLDCGNKDSTVFTNQRYLEYIKHTPLMAESAKIVNSTLIQPVFIDEKVEIVNSVVGPHVSIGKNTKIQDSVVKNSIIQENTSIHCAILENSLLGSHVKYHRRPSDLSVGDFNVMIE